jgi:hypothetical protein
VGFELCGSFVPKAAEFLECETLRYQLPASPFRKAVMSFAKPGLALIKEGRLTDEGNINA